MSLDLWPKEARGKEQIEDEQPAKVAGKAASLGVSFLMTSNKVVSSKTMDHRLQ